MEADRSPRPLRRARRLSLVTAVLAVAVLGSSVAALATHEFSDVPHDHPHAAGIGYVADTGVTQGCDATRYCPGDELTRAQMATFLHRASGNDPATPPSVNAERLQGQPASAFARTGDLPRTTTVTEHVGCVGTSFLSTTADVPEGHISNHGRYVTGPGGALGVRCPVTLPDGARLTSATFRVSDTSPVHNVGRVQVSRRELLGISVTDLAVQRDVTTDPGTGGAVTVTLPIPPANAVVDNSRYGYTLDVVLGPSNPGAGEYVYVVGATLTYEIDRLVP